MQKRIALFEVKALDGSDPNGEFEAILSVPTVDRDGEIIDGRAFEPLPAEIPIHKFHDFSSPVATAVPFYEGDVLKARGTFDPDPESQAIRAKVGRSIRYMSVGFMAATRSDQDGTPHITKAELLEASFVSVPSNREAAILAVKSAFGSTNPVVNTITVNGTTIDPVLMASAVTSTLTFDQPATKIPAATDPEEKAAAPAAADPPADVPVGQVYAAVARAQAALLAT
jgi:HK97 family phage prohead protease